MKGEGSKTVAKRISLVEGLKRDHETLDPVAVENFVKLGKAQPEQDTEPEPAPRLQLSPRQSKRGGPCRRQRRRKARPSWRRDSSP